MAERKPLFMHDDGITDEEMDPSDTATFGGLTLGGTIAMGGNKVVALADPVAPQDAATKAYVDSHRGNGPGPGTGGPPPGSPLPAATRVGQILFSADGVSFAPYTPITSSESILVDDDGILVVSG